MFKPHSLIHPEKKLSGECGGNQNAGAEERQV